LDFEETATIFKDSKALSIFNPDHSETEDRWITMDISEKRRLLIVNHTFREESEEEVSIRIISRQKKRKQKMILSKIILDMAPICLFPASPPVTPN
jgi:uncharacterized DUF497 family protein